MYVAKISKTKAQLTTKYGLKVKSGVIITPEVHGGFVPLFWGAHLANDHTWSVEGAKSPSKKGRSIRQNNAEFQGLLWWQLRKSRLGRKVLSHITMRKRISKL